MSVSSPIEIDIESALKDLRECQAQKKVSSCILCSYALECSKKQDFVEKTLQHLKVKQAALKACQDSKNLKSCGKCTEVFDCVVRNHYVSAVYLSMNQGNGGSFDF